MKLNNKLTIFSVHHKALAVPECNYIQPIQVGKIFSNLELGFISDDDGNNISAKNKTFSELTAVYWIWKNLDKISSEFIGLCHYRRYFTLPQLRVKKKLWITKEIIDQRDIYNSPFSTEGFQLVCSESLETELLKDLNSGNVIVPSATQLLLEPGFTASIKMHYIYHHIKEDWYLMRDTVIKFHPEMEQNFDIFFDSETKMHCYNMFISSKEVFGKYCSWLFPILFELERKVKLSEYEYQQRILGFLSERLFNLYLFHYNLQKAEYPLIFFN
ncbi:DUF4422 domain-containing protein [Pedobacter jejuensis]|uniref:DUF4422 domain-containing protein n=1 Tax=Pedobacter jejuensis TaxID=1268550 RepID=UPI00142D388F|nr:DUF4422 domain-containing protein [Pedobacter jejuensis]